MADNHEVKILKLKIQLVVSKLRHLEEHLRKQRIFRTDQQGRLKWFQDIVSELEEISGE